MCKKNQYLMTFWMCTYFGFFDKKVMENMVLFGAFYNVVFYSKQESSKALAGVIEEHLSDVFETEYIHLIKFFLLPPESTKPDPHAALIDPLCHLFYQSRDSKLGIVCVLVAGLYIGLHAYTNNTKVNIAMDHRYFIPRYDY